MVQSPRRARGLRGGGGRRHLLRDDPVHRQETAATALQDGRVLIIVRLRDTHRGLPPQLHVGRGRPEGRILGGRKVAVARLADHPELRAGGGSVGGDLDQEDGGRTEREAGLVRRREVAGGDRRRPLLIQPLRLVLAGPLAVLGGAGGDDELDQAIVLLQRGGEDEVELVWGDDVALSTAAGATHGEGQGDAEDEGTTLVLILAVTHRKHSPVDYSCFPLSQPKPREQWQGPKNISVSRRLKKHFFKKKFFSRLEKIGKDQMLLPLNQR